MVLLSRNPGRIVALENEHEANAPVLLEPMARAPVYPRSPGYSSIAIVGAFRPLIIHWN